MEYLLFLLSFLLPLIFFFLIKKRTSGSDHYYHQLVINLIKKNKHRFITRHDNLVNENSFSYPQLLHWILSFFSFHRIVLFSNYFIVSLSFFMAVTFTVFCLTLYPHLQSLSLDFYKWFLASVLCFIFMPYNFHPSNAKNNGLSARGLGLWMGQLFLYLICLYKITGGVNVYLLGAVIPCFVILLSSQFATQFLAFSTPLLMLFYWDIKIAIPVGSAAIFYFLLMPKVASRSFKGQLNHKKLYAKYLAKVFILKLRPSVWKDLFYVLPKTIFRKLKGDPEVKRSTAVIYFLGNPVIIAFLYMPFLILLPIYLSRIGTMPLNLEILVVPVFVCLLIFLLTTLKNFRFLGEPERYLEFAFGISAAASAIVLPATIFYTLLTCCVFYLGYSFYIQYFQSKAAPKTLMMQNIQQVRDFLSTKDDVRLISNSTEVTKFFLDINIKLFFYLVNNERMGKYHFKDIHGESYFFLNPKVIPELILNYQINRMVLVEKFWPEYKTDLLTHNLSYKIELDFTDLKLISFQRNGSLEDN